MLLWCGAHVPQRETIEMYQASGGALASGQPNMLSSQRLPDV